MKSTKLLSLLLLPLSIACSVSVGSGSKKKETCTSAQKSAYLNLKEPLALLGDNVTYQELARKAAIRADEASDLADDADSCVMTVGSQSTTLSYSKFDSIANELEIKEAQALASSKKEGRVTYANGECLPEVQDYYNGFLELIEEDGSLEDQMASLNKSGSLYREKLEKRIQLHEEAIGDAEYIEDAFLPYKKSCNISGYTFVMSNLDKKGLIELKENLQEDLDQL